MSVFDEQYQLLREAYRSARYQDFVEAFSAAIIPETVASSPPSAEASQKLRDFSLANGRDLEDVNQFLREVDTDLASSFLPS